jgi:hypothetical protein
MLSGIIKAILGNAFFLHLINLSAQVAAVNFTVQVPREISNDNNVYIVGSFNYWHPGDSLYKMNKTGKEIYTITLPLFEGRDYQYKYTAGNWDKVEVAANDSDINNRRFFSLNGKSISDTVVKWKKPKAEEKKTISPQMQKINAMKDSTVAKLKPKLNKMLGLLKLYVENLLQEKPDKKAFRRMNKEALDKIGEIYGGIADLFWNVFVFLRPEQKKMILKAIKEPGDSDFINTFSKALNDAVGETKPRQ